MFIILPKSMDPLILSRLYLNIIVFNTIVLFFSNASYFIALRILLSRRCVGHTGQGLGDYLMVAAVTVVVSDTEEDVISLGNTIPSSSSQENRENLQFCFSSASSKSRIAHPVGLQFF